MPFLPGLLCYRGGEIVAMMQSLESLSTSKLFGKIFHAVD